MARKEVAFLDSDLIPWSQIFEGVYEKRLCSDDETGAYTRLVKFDAGAEVREILTHDFYEEFILIDGTLIEKTLNKTFKQGGYSFRPPGMKHGPFLSPSGCLAVEIRYYGTTPKGISSSSFRLP